MIMRTSAVRDVSTHLLESCASRVQEIQRLYEYESHSPAILSYIRQELSRLKSELANIKCLLKSANCSNMLLIQSFELQSELSLIERIITAQSEPSTIGDQLYHQIGHDVSLSRKVELFAGFEPSHPDDELPGFSYGVKLYFQNGKEKTHVFFSGADGCIMSERANERRKRTFDTVIAIINKIVHDTFHNRFENVECVIRCDMEINRLHCPDPFILVKNGPSQRYSDLIEV